MTKHKGRNLNADGVVIPDEIVAYDNGKYVQIMDAERNKIEPWELPDSIFTQMGGKTTK